LHRDILRFIANASWFIAILVMLDHGLVANGVPWIVAWYDPTVEHHQMRIELEESQAAGKRVVFLGGGHVADGIFTGVIQKTWMTSRLDYVAFNAGMPGLRSEELPMIEQFVFGGGVVAAVCLYDYDLMYSKQNVTPVGTRWEVAEWLGFYTLGEKVDRLGELVPDVLGQRFFTARHRNVIWNLWTDLAEGSASGHTVPAVAPTVMPWIPQAALCVGALDRPGACVFMLDTPWNPDAPGAESLAARGLRRFLLAARSRGVRVILMPYPEALSADKAAAVDSLVGAIAKQEGATFLPRTEVMAFSVDPRLYLDSDGHLNEAGAKQFSRWLAARVQHLITP